MKKETQKEIDHLKQLAEEMTEKEWEEIMKEVVAIYKDKLKGNISENGKRL